MAVIITSNNGKIHYGVNQFICDAAADVVNLPVDGIWPGSTAYVITSCETYMFNGHKEWIKISTGGGGGGGTGTAATIQVGEVVTGQPGSSVTIQNSGTESAAVFDFSIPRGEPFQIKKVYNSIESMNADYNNPNIHIGDLVCIVTDPSDPDNASLYIKGDTQYEFFVDMSGATGIQGATGAKGEKGDKGDAFVYDDFTPEQLAGLVGPEGVGIESVVLNNDYTLTFTYTDGDTVTTGSVRGPKGDAFTYEDFTPEQLAALTGPQGPEGPAGADGQPGPAGADGKDGEDGAQGPQGIQGNAGPSGVGIASVTQGEEESTVRITLTNGTYYEVELDTIQGPQGEKGDTFTYSDLTPAQIASLKGAKGDTGAQGSAGTITIGTVTTGATPSVTNVGTPQNAILNIVLPAGSAYPIVGTYPTTSDAEADIANIPANSMVIIAGTGSDNGDVLINEGGTLVYVTNLTGAQGIQGPQGETGAAATITVGTVTTGAVPSVTNSGTSSAVVLDFVLPAATLEGITLPTVQEWEEGDKIVVTDPDGEVSKLDIDDVGEEIIKNTPDADFTTNNKTIEGAINELDDVKVPETRTIAGLDLDEDITKDELLEALGIVLAAGNTITIGGLTVYKQRQTSTEILSKTVVPELTGTISFFQNGVNVYGNLSIMANSNTFTISDGSDPTTNIKDALVIEGDFGLLPIPGSATTYDSHQCGIGPCHCEFGGIQNFRIVTNNADTEIIQIHGWIEGTIGPKRVDNVFLNRPFVYMTADIEGVGVEYDHHNLEVTGYLKLNTNSTAVGESSIAMGEGCIAKDLEAQRWSYGARGAFGQDVEVYGTESFGFGYGNKVLGSRGFAANYRNLVISEAGAIGTSNDLMTGRFNSASQAGYINSRWPRTPEGTYYNYAYSWNIKHYDNFYINGSAGNTVEHIYLDEDMTTEVTGYTPLLVYADNVYTKSGNDWYLGAHTVPYTKISGDTAFVRGYGPGQGAFSAGAQNTVAGSSAFASGYGNAVKGEGSAVFGKFNAINSTGQSNFIAGYMNNISGTYNYSSACFGQMNSVEGSSCLVGGYGNYAYGEAVLMAGKFNYSGGGQNLICGNNNVIGGSQSGAIGYYNTTTGLYNTFIAGNSNVCNSCSDTLIAGGYNYVDNTSNCLIGGHYIYSKAVTNERVAPVYSIAAGEALDIAGRANAVFGENNKVYDNQSSATGIGNVIGTPLAERYIPASNERVNAYFNPSDEYFYTDKEFTTKVTPDTTKYYWDKTVMSSSEQTIGSGLYFKYDDYDDYFYPVLVNGTGENEKRLYGANSAEGIYNLIKDNAYAAHVEGYYNTTAAPISHVEGASHAIGAKSSFHHVEGFQNELDSSVSNTIHIEGESNYAEQGSGGCHIEGYSNTTNNGAYRTHVEGMGNTVSGTASHIEGQFNTVNPGGQENHVEGGNNTLGAGVSYVHVEGRYHNIASGSVQGTYGVHIGGYACDTTGLNTANPAIEVIGNGTVSGSTITGSNARVLRRNGDEELAGNLTIGGTPSNNSHAATVGMLKTLLLNFADEYDENEAYMQGQPVVYNWKFYVCDEDNVTGAFDDTKWTHITIAKYIDTLLNT